MLKLLVEKGADLEGDIGDKYTVLFFAVFQNLIDLAEVRLCKFAVKSL